MTAVDTEPRVSADTLPDLASAAITAMVERLRGSVVQVRGNGRGGGAGVIWRAGGAVLTNHHVVAANGDDPHVILADGRRLAARLVASNPTLDLALLQVEADGLPAAPAGDSSRLRVGELVFAIGHPWGQRGVVTAGIISGLGIVGGSRGEWQAQYVRSDVRLAPGNSGGPLLNARGEVIGINAMIFGGDLAVAIPSYVANSWLASLARQPGYLGISVQQVELPAAARVEARAERTSGLLVVAVAADSPGARAELLVGDLLLELDDLPLLRTDDLVAALAGRAAGSSVRLALLRGGVPRSVEVTLGER